MAKELFTWPEGEKIVFVRPPKEEYNGNLDCFYSPDLFPELAPLKENWMRIRNEILEFEEKNGVLSGMNSMSPAETAGGAWSLIYLVSFLWKFHKNRSKFPVTCNITDQIPGCVFAGISILPPQTEIKPHFGDTNAIIRTHLGLIVPEEYPICAIKVGEEERGWKEGELLCFINVRKHSVWNRGVHRRYVLMFDFIPQILMDRKMEICSKALGSQSFIYLYKHISVFRKTPLFLHNSLCSMFALFWRLYLPVQRRFKFL
jgi:aspartyl/asparaginyl beta-hydroxylase (cupin superfamily)